MTIGTRIAVLGLALLAACAPVPTPAPGDIPAGDPTRGEAVFWAGGCGTCHASPASDPARAPRLGGGRELVSRYGTFVVPNISPDPVHGIGAWSGAQFAAAMTRGVSPEGAHYYPAFPYPSYARMRAQDVADLWAWLRTLPPEARANPPHRLRFPYGNRALLGVWNRRHLRPGPVAAIPGGAELARGRY
ncbi:MAG: cytochrome c, partial [Roseovarius sp.]|nr:cytochrome c [Roseovarius sp.]